jgi:hypothetical protein
MRRPSVAVVAALGATLWAAAGEAPLEFHGPPEVSGLKCTEKGPPSEPTKLLGYLDHFVLEVSLKRRAAAGDPAGRLGLAAWFGRVAEGQLDAKFPRPEDRGRPCEIRDGDGELVPPQHPDNAKAIAFHPEASNKTPKRANLSKGIGGAPVPLVPAEAGATKLYSSMHQRFSYSLVGFQQKHFADYGARYSLEQLSKLPPGVYHLHLPFTVALLDGDTRVVAVRHGAKVLKLDLSAANRAATLESLKGSGSPLLPLE